MRSGSRSESRIMANSSPAMRASVSCGFSSRPSRRDSVSRIESPAEKPTDSLTCLKRSMSMTSTVGRTPSSWLAKVERRLEAVVEELAVRQAGEVVVHGVVQQALLGGLRCSVTSASVPTMRMTSPSEPITGRALRRNQ